MRTPLPSLTPKPADLAAEAAQRTKVAAERAYSRASAIITLGLLLGVSVPYLILKALPVSAPAPLSVLEHRALVHPASVPNDTHKKSRKSA
jgi:hypothetical protein